ncbi:hypothetical protein [Kordia sp.]|uniref:hypothetical protein n=1 Tax=Kordia sp. TaxID=1965332 RepID=UPI003B5A8F74
MKKIVLTSIFILFILAIFRIVTYPNFKKLKTDLNVVYNYPTERDWKLTYDSDVEFEKQSGINFINEIAQHAEIYSGYFSLSKKINKKDTEKLVKILNDSTSYVWGKIETFKPNQSIIFYDQNDKVIGITELDCAKRQTHSSPMTRTMKWGFLSYAGRDSIYEIIEKYK